MPDATIWYVQRTTVSSAYLIPLWSGKKKPITTRKRVTKMVADKPLPIHVSLGADLEVLDPKSALTMRLKEKIMGDAETATTEAPQPERATQVYVRTDKQAKEMRGQGAIVLSALDEMKSGTVAQITSKCKGKFQTRQDDARIVGFYLSKFKREGLVKVAAAPAPPEAASQPSAAAEEIEA